MKDKEIRRKRRFLWTVRLLRAHIIRRMVWRNKTVLGVTGSCAKSSTTSFLGNICSDHAPCVVGSGNTLIRIVLRILRHKANFRFFVQEVGISAPGDMKEMANLLRPDVAVITTIGRDHYSSFRTLEATAEEKGLLVEALAESGTAVLNADDPHVFAMAKRTKARVLTYGLGENADVRASDIEADWPNRLSLTISYRNESVRLQTGLFGDLPVTSVLAATSAALASGVNLKQCAQSLNGIEAVNRRMSLHQTGNGIWFVNDTFKAPYWTVTKVLDQLKDARAPRKTAVFGAFSDISGSDSPKYRATARATLEFCDRVIFIGIKAKHIRKMISSENMNRLFAFDEPAEACRMLQETAMADELILLKSNGLEHLERLIYGQDAQLNCWKYPCHIQMSCDICEESGLASSACVD